MARFSAEEAVMGTASDFLMTIECVLAAGVWFVVGYLVQ